MAPGLVPRPLSLSEADMKWTFRDVCLGPEPDLPSSQGSNVELVVLDRALRGSLAAVFFAYNIWLHETRLCAAYSRRVGNVG
jgi:hypothetical protein